MFFWRGVSAGQDDPGRKLDAELAEIEERTEVAAVQQRASLFNRAGDLCIAVPAREKLAISYYGRAINCYIESGLLDAAAVLCRKLIRHSPVVVRAHCTLAVLALLDRRLGDAAIEIDSYVQSARRTRTERIAIPRLRMMAAATDEPLLRAVLVDALQSLGDPDGANHARNRPPGALTADERRARLLYVATLDPHELWGRAWIQTSAPQDGRPQPADGAPMEGPSRPPPISDSWRSPR